MAIDGEEAILPVVLAGGSGTRLWPRSTEQEPKQFLPLIDGGSLFQQTLRRAAALPGSSVRAPIVIANAAHRELVQRQASAVGIEIGQLVLEPTGRNTAPAIAVAALLAAQAMPAVDARLLVLPADHVVPDTEAFAAAVTVAMGAANSGRLVTFGVIPHRPETGYGYIERGEVHEGWAAIRRFVEKPDLATAEAYVRSGDYWWNSGMFLFPVSALLEEIERHANPLLEACKRAMAVAEVAPGIVRLNSEFAAVPAVSIDYGIMEATTRGAVVPLRAGWNDVGSWAALHEVAQQDVLGNSTTGDVVLESCTNTFVTSTSRTVAAIGLQDVIVVETKDAVLVVHRDHAQLVKRVVERLANAKREPR
jgi:mannose-1-phosphate guanylyltransferase / mannose-6-phosphate isomerase